MTVIDTGPLVAVADTSDKHHDTYKAWFVEARDEAKVIPAPVLGEAWYLIGQRCGPAVEARFIADLAAGTYGVIVAPTTAHLTRAAELVGQYASLRLGGTDATVIATAEAMNIGSVATLDQRHFRVVQPRHRAALDLRPS